MAVERVDAHQVRVTTPLTEEDVAQLRAGDHARISGVIYTARDAAHKRMVAALEQGQPLPIDVRNQVIYYVGPTPARPGRVIGSAGPTTSMRLDPFTPPLLAQGLKGAIGKGGRGPAVREALQRYKAVYFMAVGGTGALLSRHIKSVEVVAYEDLGTEAIRRMEVEDLPCIVVCDMYGNYLMQQGKEQYRRLDLLGSYQPTNVERAG